MIKKEGDDEILENGQSSDDEISMPEDSSGLDSHLDEWLPEDPSLQQSEQQLTGDMMDDFEDKSHDSNDAFDSVDEIEADPFDDDSNLFEENTDPKEELMEKLEEVQAYIMNNKPAVLGGMIIALALLVWFLGGSSENKTKKSEALTHQEEVTGMLTDREEALEQELKNFEEHFSEFSSEENHKVSDLAAKVNLLFDQAKNTKQIIIEQNRQLSEIKHAISNLAGDRARKHRHAKALHERGMYAVSAIVPGRVWLRSVNGHEFTATVGDKIEGYGAVVKIEPDYGRVLTSSGKVIYLGKDDS